MDNIETDERRVYQCDHCGYRCHFRQNLRRHRKTHEAKNVHCEHCPYTCRLPQHLRRHLRLVHSFNPDKATGPLFVCASCPFATGSAKAMGTHCARLHNDLKPWRCSRCEYRARSRCIVRYHEEQVHERRRPFTCETCGLSVVSRRVLAIHRVVHSTDPTPYRCDRCSYATRFLSNLTKHMIVHTDAKPFECSACAVRFARKANLKTHLNKAHRRGDATQTSYSPNFDGNITDQNATPDANYESSEYTASLWRMSTQADFMSHVEFTQNYGESPQNSVELHCSNAEYSCIQPEQLICEDVDEKKSLTDNLSAEVTTFLLKVPSVSDVDLGSVSQDSCTSDVQNISYNNTHYGDCIQQDDLALATAEYCSRGCEGDCLLHCILAL